MSLKMTDYTFDQWEDISEAIMELEEEAAYYKAQRDELARRVAELESPIDYATDYEDDPR